MRKLLFIVSWFLVSNWLWDISHQAYFLGSGWLTNGVWFVSALMVYHLAWYSSIAAFFAMVLYCVALLEKIRRLEN